MRMFTIIDKYVEGRGGFIEMTNVSIMLFTSIKINNYEQTKLFF